jgi:hypothetical protein
MSSEEDSSASPHERRPTRAVQNQTSDAAMSVDRAVKLVLIVVPIALVSCVALDYLLGWRQTREAERQTVKISPWIPELIPAPSIADQTKTIAAMKAHPNPPFDRNLLPSAGANAAQLLTLFAAMNSTTNPDGTVNYSAVLKPAPSDHPVEVTEVSIDVGGNPPRVIRCGFATFWRP